MTKHLYSTLKKAELLALCEELRVRIRVAHRVLNEHANEIGVDPEAISPHLQVSVYDACISGMGFAAEEIRGMPRSTPRTKLGTNVEDDAFA